MRFPAERAKLSSPMLGLMGGLGEAIGGYPEVEQPPAPPPSTTRAGPVLPDPERCCPVWEGTNTAELDAAAVDHA
jgi:hypothetical protein